MCNYKVAQKMSPYCVANKSYQNMTMKLDVSSNMNAKSTRNLIVYITYPIYDLICDINNNVIEAEILGKLISVNDKILLENVRKKDRIEEMFSMNFHLNGGLERGNADIIYTYLTHIALSRFTQNG